MKKVTILQILPYVSELKALGYLDSEEVEYLSTCIREKNKDAIIDKICSLSMERQHQHFDTILSLVLQQ